MRPIVLGNGSLFVGITESALVGDFMFPAVDFENQVGGGSRHRVGVWTDEGFSWLGADGWRVSAAMRRDTAAGAARAEHAGLGVALDFTDVVYNERNIFLREIVVRNLRDVRRAVKVYFGQEFHISETTRGDTAYYDPQCHAVIHYKGRRAFLVNAMAGGKTFEHWTVGVFGIEGKEGSFVDAEDGALARNPIEHGAADSVIEVSASLAPSGECVLHYWIAAGELITDVAALNQYVLEKTPAYLMKTAQDYWAAWAKLRPFTFYGLPEHAAALFRTSLFVLHAHADRGGGVSASGDSELEKYGRDTYSYVWPRDGAIVAAALARAGDFGASRRFFEFANRVVTADGYFLHKYRSDGALGSSWHPWLRDGRPELPIQEDETALVLHAFWTYYALTLDLEFAEEVYNSLVKRCADFLARHRYERAGLPYPSYDLWEEKYGVSTFTSAAVVGALRAGAGFADLLGKDADAARWRRAADEIAAAIVAHLYDADRRSFVKLIAPRDGGEARDVTLDMSSVYGVAAFGVLPIDDARVEAAIETVERDLALPWDGSVGGVPRYAGDRYYRVPESARENPWIITTLWLARLYVQAAKNDRDLGKARRLIVWAADRALAGSALPEQVHPVTGAALSATPLAWSHAEYIHTIVDYLEKAEALGLCKACYPL